VAKRYRMPCLAADTLVVGNALWKAGHAEEAYEMLERLRAALMLWYRSCLLHLRSHRSGSPPRAPRDGSQLDAVKIRRYLTRLSALKQAPMRFKNMGQIIEGSPAPLECRRPADGRLTPSCTRGCRCGRMEVGDLLPLESGGSSSRFSRPSQFLP